MGFLSVKDFAVFSPLDNVVVELLLGDGTTLYDPITAILLILKPKTGLYLALTVILFDIAHNNIFYSEELYFNSISITDWIKKYWMISMQIIFGVFVISTFKSNLTNVKNAELIK